MKMPKSQQQIYEALKPLVPVMDAFKETKDGQLKADQVALLKEVHQDINVFCGGCLPRVFNTNCGSCVREFFEVVISFFDRLHRNPDINKDLTTPEQAFEEANQPLNTPDTRTKWQKTADTKRANAAKKAEEEKKKA